MRLCKHSNYKVIDDIYAPKYSTDEILINVDKVNKNIDHYIIKFTACNKYPDWFYMSRKTIQSGKTQPNGRGRVYCVPMDKRETFEPEKHCEHTLK